MKKVRLAIGAAGALGVAPAFGLLAPGAATLAAHAPKEATKSVALDHATAGPQVNPFCASITTSAHDGIFYAGAEYAPGCVGEQRAVLKKEQTGLADRIRDYVDGFRDRSVYIAGVIGSGITAWSSQNSVAASLACQALVANGDHADVEYGPVCVDTY
jgi:hypothetical protein